MDLLKHGFSWQGTRDVIVDRFIRVSAWLSIAIVFLILVFIAKEAIPLFYEKDAVSEVGWSRLFLPQNYGTPDAPLAYSWHPVSVEPKYSLMPLLLGTLKVTIIAMIFSVPISLAAAIYTAEFASKWAREAIKPIVELLAGFPSVVLGFFALIVLASWRFSFAVSAATGALSGILIAPITLVSYDMGTMLALKGFAAAILGGMGNPLGSVIGGMVVGLIEALAAGYISSQYKDAAAFLVIVLVLFIFPRGLFGKAGTDRV